MSVAIRSCSPDDLERLIPLLDEEFVFGKGRAISLRQRFPTVFCRDNLHRILLCADEDGIVSALALRLFDWQADGETFRGAMIGMVYTSPARRGEGWASRLLATAATRLRDEGADFGVLWTGQAEFYARLGWKAADCSILGEIELDQATPEATDAVNSPLCKRGAGGDFSDAENRDTVEIPPTPPLQRGEPQGEHQPSPQERTCVHGLTIGVDEQFPEELRRRWLNATTLRRPEDYRQLPLPAERVDLLRHEDQDKAAYALLGSSGTTGFLYELAGHPDSYAALWREACRDRQRIFVNDSRDSPSALWLSRHTGIIWQNKRLAMWLPLSARVTAPRLEQWVIPYFDRI